MTLQARGLRKRLGTRQVVDGVDLDVPRGAVVGLLGPNGAGKTTTFRLLCGLLPPDAGTVTLDGRTLRGGLAERTRLGLSLLPQHATVLPGLNVRAHIVLALELRGASPREADRLLAEAGLEDRATDRVTTLSGGERRRLEIARCLATNPRVVLLDEPFAGVDPRAVDDLARRIRALADGGLGVLLTDHAAREALALCDLVALLDQGRVVHSGTPEEVAQHPEARARWLGEGWRG